MNFTFFELELLYYFRNIVCYSHANKAYWIKLTQQSTSAKQMLAVMHNLVV